MLVLTRRLNEEIIIGDNIRITVTAIQGDKVRIGITAPESIRVDRAEVHARRKEFAADQPVVVPAATGTTGPVPAPAAEARRPMRSRLVKPRGPIMTQPKG